jgi:hypothetical protein
LKRILCSCSNFTTSGKHAAAVLSPAGLSVKHPGDSVLLNGVFNQPAISDNSKSPQDAAIRYEPAAAVKQHFF